MDNKRALYKRHLILPTLCKGGIKGGLSRVPKKDLRSKDFLGRRRDRHKNERDEHSSSLCDGCRVPTWCGRQELRLWRRALVAARQILRKTSRVKSYAFNVVRSSFPKIFYKYFREGYSIILTAHRGVQFASGLQTFGLFT